MSIALAQRLSLGLGIVYAAIGVLGFIPGVTMDAGHGHGLLLGIFAVNTLHNVVHLAVGAVLIWAAMTPARTIMVNRALAVVFALLVVVSLIAPVAEGVAINLPDTGLHLLTALATGAIGFLGDRRRLSASA
jgi:hypothetical protein